MKTIYLDSNFMCHTTNDGTRIEVQTDYLDSFCDEAIALFRFIPEGRMWMNPKGQVIYGEFLQATDSVKINDLQLRAEIEDMKAALALLGVTE